MTLKRRKLPKPVVVSTLKNNNTIRKSKTHQFSQALISRYHTLNKEKERLKNSPLTKESLMRLKTIDEEISKMGGLDAYQKASLLGQDKRRGGDSSKWFIKQLLSMKNNKEVNNNIPIKNENENVNEENSITFVAGKPLKSLQYKLLDVGAVSGKNYEKENKWIKTKAIDLNPQDPLIEKADFFEYKIPKEKYHILCLSLVINFVGDIKKRGIMIARANKFLIMNGLLFIVLPYPCVINSRYCTDQHLQNILKYLGFNMVTKHFSKKLAYYIFRKTHEINLKQYENSTNKPKFPKVIINDGVNRNNFCIVI